MRVGVSIVAQNASDWPRFLEAEQGGEVGPPAISDATIWAEELQLVRLVEPLGFDSLWTPEHHFTPYAMIPNPLEFLAHVAGLTEHIDVGTMVTVLPWHNPVRVAESLSLLQHFLGPDRQIFAGFGRGAGKREFPPLFSPMERSRQRFNEAIEVIRLALTQERFEFAGEEFQYDDISMRPRPRDAQLLLDNMYGAWGGADSQPLVAAAGLKPLMIPQRPWEDYQDELASFRQIRADSGWAPARPIVIMWVYCAATEEAARVGAHAYIPAYADTAAAHYELFGSHFQHIKGYERYHELSSALNPDLLHQVWLDNHVWGTPEQCIEKFQHIKTMTNCEEVVATFRFGPMPYEVAEASMKLFARECLPALHATPVDDVLAQPAAV
jgi:alkanesulfonate monooxygenase SsuD/methylene tetrahydromethanopterin reductase-like flavin-dependent oxidoreductase (luciferase family)